MEYPDRENIIRLCRRYGADLAGIAPSSAFTGARAGNAPADKLKGCRSVIVLAGTFPRESLDMDTVAYTAVRNGMVERMDAAAVNLAGFLKEMNWKAKPVRSLGGSWKEGRFYGTISLKHAGELAGLGRINRNYLLTNFTYGNLMWLSAVLTDVELEPDPMAGRLCDDCGRCVAACPSGALDDGSLFGQKECYKTCYKVKKGVLDLKCWRCREVCNYRFGSSAGGAGH